MFYCNNGTRGKWKNYKNSVSRNQKFQQILVELQTVNKLVQN